MLENIALIQEVHAQMPTKQAQDLAKQYLLKIELESIGTKRINQCSSVEIFYIMCIRALMMEEKKIIIKTPYTLVENLRDIASVLDNIAKLNYENKEILILDTQNNQIHYKGCQCNIVK